MLSVAVQEAFIQLHSKGACFDFFVSILALNIGCMLSHLQASFTATTGW
jgi:hypothetical protein